MIAGLAARLQGETPVAGRYQRLQSLLRGFGEGLGGATVVRQLRRVDTDQPHAAAIAQAHGIAVHHPRHLDVLQGAGRPAGLRRTGEGGNHGHEKGAHQGRLSRYSDK